MNCRCALRLLIFNKLGRISEISEILKLIWHFTRFALILQFELNSLILKKENEDYKQGQ